MSEEKKNWTSKITPGNIITIGIFLVGLITAWANINSHINNESIHLKKTDNTLTEIEKNNLVKFTAIVQDILPTIKDNQAKIIIIQRDQATHKVEFKYLNSEHNDLEDKLSREINRLETIINE